MRIGAVARQSGVNVQTLRYYERRGLLRSTRRLASGYREYDAQSVALVRFIKNAQKLGFTLEEIGELMSLREQRRQSKTDVCRLATVKIGEIDRRIEMLRAMRTELDRLVRECAVSPEDTDCVVIDYIDHGNGTSESDGGRRTPEMAKVR